MPCCKCSICGYVKKCYFQIYDSDLFYVNARRSTHYNFDVSSNWRVPFLNTKWHKSRNNKMEVSFVFYEMLGTLTVWHVLLEFAGIIEKIP